jgi:hypothetical protein
MKQIFAWTEPGLAKDGEVVQFFQVFAGVIKREIRIRDRQGRTVSIDMPSPVFNDLVTDLHNR